MDSGKSGSLQSSSGGDDEFDSVLLAAQPQQAAVNASMYGSMSKFFEQSLPPLPGEDNSIMWLKSLRSDPTSAPMINPMLASTGSSSPNSRTPVAGGFAAQSAPVSFPSAAEQSSSGPGAAGGTSAQLHVVRNPKKRSRASRRAPTTVLTTDTANFRAMVQEFTGIPAPPFTSLPFSRTRLDSLGSPSSVRSAAAASQFDNIRQPPSYLRRPFAQKIQSLQPPSSSFLPSTLVDILASSTANNISSGSSISTSQNPILFGISPNTSQVKTGAFMDEFCSANAALSALPSLISPSEASTAMSRRSENTPASWDGGGLRSKLNDDNQGQGQSQLHPHNNIFSCNTPTANGKLNFPANSSSNLHSYKMPENMGGSRGEGMMESWICSSSE